MKTNRRRLFETVAALGLAAFVLATPPRATASAASEAPVCYRCAFAAWECEDDGYRQDWCEDNCPTLPRTATECFVDTWGDYCGVDAVMWWCDP